MLGAGGLRVDKAWMSRATVGTSRGQGAGAVICGVGSVAAPCPPLAPTHSRHYVSNAHGYLFNDLGAFFRLETAPAAGFLLDIWLIPAATQPAAR